MHVDSSIRLARQSKSILQAVSRILGRGGAAAYLSQHHKDLLGALQTVVEDSAQEAQADQR